MRLWVREDWRIRSHFPWRGVCVQLQKTGGRCQHPQPTAAPWAGATAGPTPPERPRAPGCRGGPAPAESGLGRTGQGPGQIHVSHTVSDTGEASPQTQPLSSSLAGPHLLGRAGRAETPCGLGRPPWYRDGSAPARAGSKPRASGCVQLCRD